MKLTQINQDTSGETGFLDFDVINAGTIRRVTVSPSIATGDMFNIYHGDGVYVAHAKRAGRFLAKSNPAEPLVKTLERSIRKSEVYQGEHTSSASFAPSVVAQLQCESNCQCQDSLVRKLAPRRVVAVDLQYPDFTRESPRQLVLAALCSTCGQEALLPKDYAPAHLTGHVALSDAAQVCAARLGMHSINWQIVQTGVGAFRHATKAPVPIA